MVGRGGGWTRLLQHVMSPWVRTFLSALPELLSPPFCRTAVSPTVRWSLGKYAAPTPTREGVTSASISRNEKRNSKPTQSKEKEGYVQGQRGKP